LKRESHLHPPKTGKRTQKTGINYRKICFSDGFPSFKEKPGL